jgi:hypothetical protein
MKGESHSTYSIDLKEETPSFEEASVTSLWDRSRLGAEPATVTH